MHDVVLKFNDDISSLVNCGQKSRRKKIELAYLLDIWKTPLCLYHFDNLKILPFHTQPILLIRII